MVAVATDAYKLHIYLVGPVRDQDCSSIGLLLGGMTNEQCHLKCLQPVIDPKKCHLCTHMTLYSFLCQAAND